MIIISKCCKAEIAVTTKGKTICVKCRKKLIFNDILEKTTDPYENLF